MPAFVRDLERLAQAAARAEADFRLQARDQLASLEAARIAAYRRLNLLNGMAQATTAAAEDAAAIEAGIDHACARAGWSEADAAYAELRERLRPTAEAMRAADRPPAPVGSPPVGPPPSPQAPLLAFAGFEAWYRARFDADFLTLLANDTPIFQSAVDF